MRPKHLKSPFKWADRHVILHDRVLFVPPYCIEYDSYQFPGWDHSTIFGNDNPVIVEYCTGNGAWIAEKARAHPDRNWVAVEIRFDRVQKIWAKVKNFQLPNLLVICGEGHLATRLYFPEQSVKETYINFPDPWPKNRHAKHRLVQSAFLQQVHRILRSEGSLILATDDPTYSDLFIEEMLAQTGFQSCYPAPYYCNDWPDYGTSYFDTLWRDQGRDIRYHQFQKA